MKKVRLNFYVSEDDVIIFKKFCDVAGVTMSEMFRRFIIAYNELHVLEKYIPKDLLKYGLGNNPEIMNTVSKIIKKIIKTEINKKQGEINCTLTQGRK